jgi:hypothetical protein
MFLKIVSCEKLLTGVMYPKPQVLVNAELYGLVLAARLKKGYHHQIWEANLQSLGANVPSFINIMTSMFHHLFVTWGQFATQKC